MSRYEMSDGMFIETDNASASWDEETQWDGNNHISLATGSQWDHQRLYRSRRGRYFVESSSQWQGSRDSAEWLSNEEAVRWLLRNEYGVDDENFPDDLKELVDDMTD